MPELRRDPIVDRWVILAEKRAFRPNEFETQPGPFPPTSCPFCEGNEDQTPAEVLAYRDSTTAPDRRGWRVRVVPNKYPALEQGDPGKPRHEPLLESLPGVGAHEVIIESPRHIEQTGQLTVLEVGETLRACKSRLRHWQDNSPWAYGMWFKNVGQSAGASLSHLHSQLIVLPIVPKTVREELDGSLRFFRHYGRCVFCEMIGPSRRTEPNILLTTSDFVALCPLASRFPYETWVLPRHHASHFEQIDQTSIGDLAAIVRQVLVAIERTLESAAYNVLLHTAPFDTPELPHYHWHMEILPRTTCLAGFEWGTGFTINPIPPARAAQQLKDSPF